MTKEELLQLIDRAADEGWKELDLSGMSLSELPREVKKLTQLESLVLGRFDLEKEIWIGNRFIDFPDEVFQLPQLRCLRLSANQITVIPEAIAHLSNLTILELQNNQIRSIPKAIGHLTNLTELDLYHNQVSHIPDEIVHLSHLTKLLISRN
jgi:internalin A